MTEKVKGTHADHTDLEIGSPEGGSPKAKRPADKTTSPNTGDNTLNTTVTIEKAGKVTKEDLSILFAGTELSEDFQDKAFTLFEGAVSAKVEALKEELAEESKTALEEEKLVLENRLSGYIDLVVENWLKDNELAVTNGIKAEISESFIAGIASLFAEHNIDLPDSKINVVEGFAEKIDSLEKDLNEAYQDNIKKTALIESFNKKEIFNKLSEGLDDVSKERLQKLTENISYTSEEAFGKSVQTLKESLDSNKSTPKAELNEEVKIEESNTKVATDPEKAKMSAYIEAMKQLS